TAEFDFVPTRKYCTSTRDFLAALRRLPGPVMSTFAPVVLITWSGPFRLLSDIDVPGFTAVTGVPSSAVPGRTTISVAVVAAPAFAWNTTRLPTLMSDALPGLATAKRVRA